MGFLQYTMSVFAWWACVPYMLTVGCQLSARICLGMHACACCFHSSTSYHSKTCFGRPPLVRRDPRLVKSVLGLLWLSLPKETCCLKGPGHFTCEATCQNGRQLDEFWSCLWCQILIFFHHFCLAWMNLRRGKHSNTIDASTSVALGMVIPSGIWCTVQYKQIYPSLKFGLSSPSAVAEPPYLQLARVSCDALFSVCNTAKIDTRRPHS